MNTSPHRFGKYELQERLGQSSLAEVWKAFDTQLSCYVAIKFLHPNLHADPEFATRFLREAQVIASLHHPNIVEVQTFSISHSPESASTTAYIVMDYIEGQTLADYMSNTSHVRKFPPGADITHLFSSMAMAVDYAHQRGIIHRDIKPTNILLNKHNTAQNPLGEPMLTDFGMVEIVKTVQRPLSSVFYLAPELAQGYVGNERSDIYALGVILYEIFTGVPPFQGDNPRDIMMQHINATPPPPALINPNIRPGVTDVIMRSLAKDPASRFPSANVMVAALDKALNVSVPERKFSQLNSPVDPMNSPTYITPVSRSAMGPSSPALQGTSSSQVPPPFVSTSPATPNLSTPVQMTSPGNIPRALPPAQSGTSRMTPVVSQPTPVAQSGGPTTPMSPGFLPGSSVPDLPTNAPTQPWPKSPPQKPRRRGLLITLIVLLILVLIGSGVGTYFAFSASGSNKAATPTTIPIFGHAFFVSSGLLNPNPSSREGIADQLQINLSSIPSPHPGKSYYAWLLNKKGQEFFTPIFLGKLTVNSGTVNFSYPGDSTDLLASNSRFLITEEDAAIPPTSPSLDPSAWRYYAEFSQKPDPRNPKKYSLYDHISHLLAEDPTLKAQGLTGGLDIWLFRNTEKILEWSGSARDAWQSKSVDFIRRQLTRILDYLDGATYVQADLPTSPLLVNSTIARVPLLTFDVSKQDPPGYLYHIGTKHLHEIAQLPEATAEQKALAIHINVAINNVNLWLHGIRDDAVKLMNMTNDQLLGSDGRALLNDLATLANYAFVGQINPRTNQVSEGVVQIHYSIQRLATFDIRACTSANPCAL